jgi:RHS repeat-associated protein
VAKTYDYRPFGDSLAATGELPNQGYANMEQDEESEYIQMGARTYNPALGRFMSVYPLFEAFPAQ